MEILVLANNIGLVDKVYYSTKHLIDILWLEQIIKFVNIFIFLNSQRFNKTFNDDIRAITFNEVMWQRMIISNVIFTRVIQKYSRQ